VGLCWGFIFLEGNTRDPGISWYAFPLCLMNSKSRCQKVWLFFFFSHDDSDFTHQRLKPWNNSRLQPLIFGNFISTTKTVNIGIELPKLERVVLTQVLYLELLHNWSWLNNSKELFNILIRMWGNGGERDRALTGSIPSSEDRAVRNTHWGLSVWLNRKTYWES
jgi:hypothetical protein